MQSRDRNQVANAGSLQSSTRFSREPRTIPQCQRYEYPAAGMILFKVLTQAFLNLLAPAMT